MNIKVKPDLSELKRKFAAFDASTKKRILDKVIRTDAQGFVRDVILITPPGSGKKNSGGSWGKAGKIAIYRDLVGGSGKNPGIFFPVPDVIIHRAASRDDGGPFVPLFFDKGSNLMICAERAVFRPSITSGEMRAWHQSHRGKRGRAVAGKPFRDDGKRRIISNLVVPKSAWEAYREEVYAKVGILAGGWVKAAELLNVKGIPAEAKRHASGSAIVETTNDSFRIHIKNTVGYARDADVQKRVDWVLDSGRRKKRLAKRIEVEIIAALKKQANA